MNQDSAPLLSIQNLRLLVTTRDGELPAVDDVSFDIARRETVGLVGESGSGKSMTALAVTGLHPQPRSRISSGRVVFEGKDLVSATPDQLRQIRGSRVGMILQDPNSALNPLMTVRAQVSEPLRLHRHLRGQALCAEVINLLELLRVSDAPHRLNAYPHQLSGGIKQRVVAAAALAGQPSLLVADEPTTALDVTIQAAFLAHLRSVQQELGLGILLITHDFGVVAGICDKVAVMYAGRIVEFGSSHDVMGKPAHPYTAALLRSSPTLESRPKRLVSIPGQPPSLANRPSGCAFHPRCWLHRELGEPERCRAEVPRFRTKYSSEQGAACHFAEALPAEAGAT